MKKVKTVHSVFLPIITEYKQGNIVASLGDDVTDKDLTTSIFRDIKTTNRKAHQQALEKLLKQINWRYNNLTWVSTHVNANKVIWTALPSNDSAQWEHNCEI